MEGWFLDYLWITPNLGTPMEIFLTEIHPDGVMENNRWELDYGLTIEQFFGMAFRGCDRGCIEA